MAKIKAVRDFMEEQKLSEALIQRVENYLSMLWRLHRSVEFLGAKITKLFGNVHTINICKTIHQDRKMNGHFIGFCQLVLTLE